MFYLTYNYTNARRSRMAIACVIRCKNTYGKQLRVRDIIEMRRPGLHQLLLVEINAESAEQSVYCTIREDCRIFREESRKALPIHTTVK